MRSHRVRPISMTGNVSKSTRRLNSIDSRINRLGHILGCLAPHTAKLAITKINSSITSRLTRLGLSTTSIITPRFPISAILPRSHLLSAFLTDPTLLILSMNSSPYFHSQRFRAFRTFCIPAHGTGSAKSLTTKARTWTGRTKRTVSGGEAVQQAASRATAAGDANTVNVSSPKQCHSAPRKSYPTTTQPLTHPSPLRSRTPGPPPQST